jgi:hypothetical protein
VLGVRGVFKYSGGINPGFAAAFGSRFRKLAENNSRIDGKNSSHFECSLYILDSIGFCPSLPIDRKENIPIDAMRGGEKKVFDSFAVGRHQGGGGRQNTIMLRASYHCGCSIDQNIRPLKKDM